MTAAVDYALVTGAGRGIGRAVAMALATRGLGVALVGRSRADLESTESAISSVAPTAPTRVVPCDVADARAIHSSVAPLLTELGAPRVVVNNAGVIRRVLLRDMTEADWDAVLDTNLKGTFLVTRMVLEAMLERKVGRILQVASLSATVGTARQTAYNASKWGAVGFTKSLAEELRGTGLQTMAVLPGAVDTAMLEGGDFPATMTPDAVAGTVVYLALDAPAAMNGSAVEIFGP